MLAVRERRAPASIGMRARARATMRSPACRLHRTAQDVVLCSTKSRLAGLAIGRFAAYRAIDCIQTNSQDSRRLGGR
jgi:hypothetical protein